MSEESTQTLPPETGQLLTSMRSSSEKVDRAKHLKYAYERADRILRFYRKTDAWDYDVFLAGIAANLAEYPRDIIDEVSDAARGITSKSHWPPHAAEVREACEAIAAPRRKRAAREASIKAQLDERKRLEAPREERETWDEVRIWLSARGVNVGGVKPHGETPATVQAKLGLTQAEWDAIPDAPKETGYWQGLRQCVPQLPAPLSQCDPQLQTGGDCSALTQPEPPP